MLQTILLTGPPKSGKTTVSSFIKDDTLVFHLEDYLLCPTSNLDVSMLLDDVLNSHDTKTCVFEGVVPNLRELFIRCEGMVNITTVILPDRRWTSRSNVIAFLRCLNILGNSDTFLIGPQTPSRLLILLNRVIAVLNANGRVSQIKRKLPPLKDTNNMTLPAYADPLWYRALEDVSMKQQLVSII